MEIWTNHPDLRPSVLSQYAVAVLEDRPVEEHILDRWFPSSMNPELEYELDLGSLRSYTNAMGFRAFDAEPGPVARYGFQSKTGKLPPLGGFLPMTEGEALALQRGSVPRRVIDEVYNDIDVLVRSLQNRMELERGKMLLTGSTALTGNLKTLSVDWGRKNAREATVGTLWSSGGAPFTDERAIVRPMRDENRAAAVALAPSEVIDVMEVHGDYLDAYQGITGAATAPTLITLEQINMVRRQYDLPPIVRYDAKIQSVSGGLTKVIGDNSIVYLPDGPVGETQFGRPLSATEPEVQIVAEAGGPVVFVAKEKRIPIEYHTYLDAIGMPILGDADSTARLTVLA
jgi:hypothetical protein